VSINTSEKKNYSPTQFPHLLTNNGEPNVIAEYINQLLIGSPGPNLQIFGKEYSDKVANKIEMIFDNFPKEFDEFINSQTDGMSQNIEFWQQRQKTIENSQTIRETSLTLYQVLNYITDRKIITLSPQTVNQSGTETKSINTFIPDEGTHLRAKPYQGDNNLIELTSLFGNTNHIKGRENSLVLLQVVFQQPNSIHIPKVEKNTGKSLIIQRAFGSYIDGLTDKQIKQISELPVNTRKQILVDLFTGIDELNQRGCVFGDYNGGSFIFDDRTSELWLVDPGHCDEAFSETSEFSINNIKNSRTSARDHENYFIFSGIKAGGLKKLVELLNIPNFNHNQFISLIQQKQIKNASDVAQYFKNL
jgi:hypothetical protein